MASTYSNLKFELIGTGDQSGTWGTTTNTNLGTAIEQAIVGMATISSGFTGSPLTLTLTLTDTNAAQNARALVLNLTQALGSAGTLNVPAIQKPYMIINATGQTVTVKVTGLTGVAVPTGTRAFLYNNGTDVGDFFNYASSLTLGTDLAIADGGTGASTAPNARTNLGATTVGSNLFTLTNPSAITFLRINADNTVSALDAATFRTAIGAGTTSGAAGSNTQVQYNNAGAFAGSSNLTFDGTSLTLGGNPTLSAGTANGVLYLNGSKVATSGSALTFDGSLLTQTVSDAGTSNKWSGATGKLRLRPYADSTYGAIFDSTNPAESAYLPLSLFASNIYSAADTASIWRIAGSEQMRLTSTGLGIGTSSPAYKLDLTSSHDGYARQWLSAVSFVSSADAVNGFQLRNLGSGTQGIKFANFANTVEWMRLDSSGNLGIGTSSPNAKLSVSNSGAAGLEFSPTSGYLGGGYIQGYNRSTSAFIPVEVIASQFAVVLASTQAMTLDASGNLLVGATGQTTGGEKVLVSNYSGVNSAVKLGIYAGAAGNKDLDFYSNGNSQFFTAARIRVNGDTYTDTGYMSFWTTSNNGSNVLTTAERARIDSSGNLGIGLTPVANNGILQLNSYGAIKALIEGATVSATAATGTINYDAATQAVVYYTSNASANWTVNFRGSGSLSLNSMMQTGQSLTVAFLVTQGSTAYYNSAVQVDGSSVTPKWQGGTAPSAGNASSIDSYVYTIIKTGAATFTVLASQTKFA